MLLCVYPGRNTFSAIVYFLTRTLVFTYNKDCQLEISYSCLMILKITNKIHITQILGGTDELLTTVSSVMLLDPSDFHRNYKFNEWIFSGNKFQCSILDFCFNITSCYSGLSRANSRTVVIKISYQKWSIDIRSDSILLHNLIFYSLQSICNTTFDRGEKTDTHMLSRLCHIY